ncbi:TetR/AcrR family transcriptional regulator [Nocardioides insulae]|uniref:TetR/AcrR family transcriptional regulator n=1 Tax=Nocardioides insulae TaxID=394734 RepID=UPI00040F58A0|nr:TetR/AcrR family transcriptional regulator [Nocardioides insulae]
MGVNPVGLEGSEAPGPVGNETRRALKQVARRLFAERGVRAVTVREIAREAGQGNRGAVAYHFGSKEALILELLTDAAERIEGRRLALLERLESDGGPHTLHDAVATIVVPSAAFADEDLEYGSYFNRFLLQITLGDPHFVDRALAGRWNEGYQRSLAHLRRLLPEQSAWEQSRRLLFLGNYVSIVLGAREAKLVDGGEHATWAAPDTLEVIIATGAAMLSAPNPR